MSALQAIAGILKRSRKQPFLARKRSFLKNFSNDRYLDVEAEKPLVSFRPKFSHWSYRPLRSLIAIVQSSSSGA
jgi:hypothetical protein